MRNRYSLVYVGTIAPNRPQVAYFAVAEMVSRTRPSTSIAFIAEAYGRGVAIGEGSAVRRLLPEWPAGNDAPRAT